MTTDNVMRYTQARSNRWLAVVVALSFLVCATVVVLRLGIEETPSSTTDSSGRLMGFNDKLSAEHFLIMAKNFRPSRLLHPGFFYEWLLLGAHVCGFVLLVSAKTTNASITRWFFGCQFMVFPTAIPMLMAYPFMGFEFITAGIDREAFVDVPFIWIVAHPVWVLTSFTIFLLIGGQRWLRAIWRGRRRRDEQRWRARGVR